MDGWRGRGIARSHAEKDDRALTSIFKPYVADACCLCGELDGLTGEHKIKASALRREFGNASMSIRTDSGQGSARQVRGPKAKALHFRSPMCAACNNARTQNADRAFDHFHISAMAKVASGFEPSVALQEAPFRPGDASYLDLFRYFAKLLCAHLAEVGGPRPDDVARFAIGETDQNPVFLAVDRDWLYKEIAREFGEHQYAAHGGLSIYGHRDSDDLQALHSTLTIGPIRYVFQCRLTEVGALDLSVFHPAFAAWCREHIATARTTPLSHPAKLYLGIIAEDSEP
jgi:hypothetical protein